MEPSDRDVFPEPSVAPGLDGTPGRPSAAAPTSGAAADGWFGASYPYRLDGLAAAPHVAEAEVVVTTRMRWARSGREAQGRWQVRDAWAGSGLVVAFRLTV